MNHIGMRPRHDCRGGATDQGSLLKDVEHLLVGADWVPGELLEEAKDRLETEMMFVWGEVIGNFRFLSKFLKLSCFPPYLA